MSLDPVTGVPRRDDHVTGAPAHRAGSGSPRDNGQEGGDDDRPRRSRRRLVLAGVLPLAGLAAAAVVVARGDGGWEDGDTASTATTNVPVEVRDLVLTDEYDGKIGFGATTAVTAGRSGVVTGVSPMGTTVEEGGVLFHLDLQPVVLLHGDVPAFRDLDVDADPGADITQLEQALVDLGYGDGVTVDTEFTSATADAVEAWETKLGRADPDGEVTLGDVIFAPADLRITEVTADKGTQVQSGAEVVNVADTTKVITLELTVDQVANVEAGTAVTIEMPDRSEVAGKIADVADEPTDTDDDGGGGGGGEGGDEETFAVTVTFDDPAVADAYDSGDVDVTVERSRTEDAVTVPVKSLLALSEGGYAVEVVDESQPSGSRLVAVEISVVADEYVEVTGEGIEAGVEVVVPS